LDSSSVANSAIPAVAVLAALLFNAAVKLPGVITTASEEPVIASASVDNSTIPVVAVLAFLEVRLAGVIALSVAVPVIVSASVASSTSPEPDSEPAGKLLSLRLAIL
jgi:hypothetical protein